MTSRGGISASSAAIVAVVVVVAAVAVFIATMSPTAKTGTPTSTVISTPAALVASTGQAPSAYCSEPSPPYSNNSLKIDWGNLAPGTEGIQFVCLKNTGTTGITLDVSSTLPPSVGIVTSPQAGTMLNGQGIEMVELDLNLVSSVQTGPIPSFTITIGGGG